MGDAVFHEYLHKQHYTPYLPRVDSSHGIHTDVLHRRPSFPAHSRATHLRNRVGENNQLIMIKIIYMTYLQIRCNATNIFYDAVPLCRWFLFSLIINFTTSTFHNSECLSTQNIHRWNRSDVGRCFDVFNDITRVSVLGPYPIVHSLMWDRHTDTQINIYIYNVSSESPLKTSTSHRFMTHVAVGWCT